jgi:biopolymer transport protein ExbD
MSLRDQAGRGARAQEENQIDLTPMLDVVFIMLIFFIVTSSFVKEPGVDIVKPGAGPTEACPNGTIIFAVDKQGKIHYNKNEIKLERANFFAKSAKDETPRANIVIQADQESPAYVVEQLFDTLRTTFSAPPCVSTLDE